MKNIAILTILLLSGGILAFQPSSLTTISLNNRRHNGSISSSSLAMTNKDSVSTRRQIIDTSLVSIASSILLSNPQNALATREITDASSGELPDLPPEAVRSYLQCKKFVHIMCTFYFII